MEGEGLLFSVVFRHMYIRVYMYIYIYIYTHFQHQLEAQWRLRLAGNFPRNLYMYKHNTVLAHTLTHANWQFTLRFSTRVPACAI